jgi:hypothetical protein
MDLVIILGKNKPEFSIHLYLKTFIISVHREHKFQTKTDVTIEKQTKTLH